MNESKRNLSDIESNNDRRKKIRTNNEKRSSFEDLSNEIMYEIMDFLDGCDAYDVFSNLNARYNRIANCSSYLLKINLSFISKSIFEYRCKYILSKNVDRIVSLRLSGDVSINLFLGYFSIESFIRLESLFLNTIKSDQLQSLFACLILLPRLISLSINVIDEMKNEDLIFGLIFKLPVLKYINCNIRTKFKSIRCPYLLRLSNDRTGQEQNNTIKYLVTNNYWYLDQLGPCSYIPKLHRLSCKIGYIVTNIHRDMPMLPSDLTHISLTECCRLQFDQLELFISKLCPHLQVLRLTIYYDNNYLDADRWECLIVQHILHLRIFDFQHIGWIASDDHQYNGYHSIIDTFSSPFWREHRWYFAHQHLGCSKYRIVRFYSIQVNRHEYRLSSMEGDYVCPYRDSGLNMARQVVIGNYQALIHCLLRFPHATKFTYVDRDIEDNYFPIAYLNRIVPLAQLNQLVIGWKNLEAIQLLELLRHAFNVRSLELIWFSHLPIPSLSSKQIDNDHVRTNENNVVQLISRSICNLEQLQFLMNVFPHLKFLQLNINYNDYQSIIKFLLMENRKNNPHLFSLSLKIRGRDHVIVKDVKAFLDDQNLLDNYSITFSNNAVYLWW